jgi:hypothetical protein
MIDVHGWPTPNGWKVTILLDTKRLTLGQKSDRIRQSVEPNGEPLHWLGPLIRYPTYA